MEIDEAWSDAAEPVLDVVVSFERRTTHVLGGKVELTGPALAGPLVRASVAGADQALLDRLADEGSRFRLTLTPITEALTTERPVSP